jgi:cytochrome c biogenesis protein CcmG, thiol:disulfide interchange protein DsbE
MLHGLLFFLSLVNEVRSSIERHDLASAQAAAKAYQAQAGATPELAAALSWIARGEWDAGQLPAAEQYAEQARKMAATLLGMRRLDTDPWLPTALGAAIEVHGEVLAAQGQRPEAVAFLRQELALYSATSIGERIRKNLNLIDLVGKPAPALDAGDWLGLRPPPLASLKGHPVLLFFWAHWCPDCKAEGPVLASLLAAYRSKGLMLVAPTKLYGFAAGGEPATPAAEKQYIVKVREQYYPVLAGAPIPVSAANFLNYGCSTTPTVVLLDAGGIVRFYHPGAVDEAALAQQIQKVMAR